MNKLYQVTLDITVASNNTTPSYMSSLSADSQPSPAAALAESDLSKEDLLVKLEEKRALTKKLKRENEILVERIGKSSNASEAEEEFITNALLKKMSALKASKEELALAVEQEEEQMTNQLMKKIIALQTQQNDMKVVVERLTEENRRLRQLGSNKGSE